MNLSSIFNYDSNIMNGQQQGSDIIEVCPDDVHVGKLLGSGSFASVYQVFPSRRGNASLFEKVIAKNKELFQQKQESFTCETVPSDDDEDEQDDQKQHGLQSIITTSYSINKSQQFSLSCNNRFALKRARKGTDYDKQRLEECTYVMKQEVDILSQLPLHNNIIHLFGISSNFNEEPAKGFIILQYLPETLTDRIVSWRKEQKILRKKNPLKSYFIQRFGGNEIEQNERLVQIGIGTANALSFLHQNNILYRDLKPDNVGFDEYGNVRLFDFGLSRKIITTTSNNNEEVRKLTACVGSWRYMAPEIALGRTYDYSADIHSFAILMYEVCTLSKAFAIIRNSNEMFRTVYVGSCRPSLRRIRSNSVKELLRSCWEPNPELRPTFPSIINELQTIGDDNKN